MNIKNLVKKYCVLFVALAVVITSMYVPGVMYAAAASETPGVEHVYIASDSSAVVGAKLSVYADYIGGASETNCSYKWFSSTKEEIKATDTAGAKQLSSYTKTYTLTEAEVGRYIFCVIYPSGGRSKISIPYGKIVSAGTGAATIDAASLRIGANDTRIGSTLWAHYTYQNPAGGSESGTEIVWQRADSYQGTYTDIPGATGSTYVIKPEDYGKFISFKVTLSGGTAYEMSSRIYCSPENMLTYSYAEGTDNRNALMAPQIFAATDFITNNEGNMTWSSSSTPNVYTIDAGKSIQWDKLVFVAAQMNKLTKLEVSDDGSTFTDLNIDEYSFTADTLVEYKLNKLASGRYIRATFHKTGNSTLKEIQAYLMPESFSELLGVNMEGVKYNRDEKTIYGISSTTNVGELKNALIKADSNSAVAVKNADGTDLSDTDIITNGCKLVSTSANGKTTTEYTLYGKRVVVSEVSIPTDSRYGVRAASTLKGEYKAETIDGSAIDDSKTKYQWYSANTADGEYTAVNGATGKTYTPSSTEIGKYLKLEVTPEEAEAKMSDAVGPVQVIKAGDSTAAHVYITSDKGAVVGSTLTVNYDLTGIEGECDYQWWRCNAENIKATTQDSAKQIANSDRTYTLTEEDNGKYIFCIAIPKNGGMPEISLPYGKIVSAGTSAATVDAASLRIWADDLRVGSTLYAHYAYQNPAGTGENGAIVQWKRADSFGGAYEEISGATGSTYEIKPEDYGKFLTFDVKSANGSVLATMDSRIYCTPENLGAYLVTRRNTNYNQVVSGLVNGAGDFIVDNKGNMTNGVQGQIYTIDAKNDIVWDSIVLRAQPGGKLTKVETSKDNKEFTDVGISELAFENDVLTTLNIGENKLAEGRYIRLTFEMDKIDVGSGNMVATNSYLKEFQMYLSPESLSEILAVDLNDAIYDRDQKTITNIISGTTVKALKEALKVSTSAPDVKVLNAFGNEAADTDMVGDGFSLVITSNNDKTTTVYRLANGNKASAFAFDGTNAYIISDGEYENITVIYAAYNEDVLADVNIEIKSLNKGENKFAVPSGIISADKDRIRIMVWDSLETLIPLF